MVAYIGLASNTFKERYLNHTLSFRNEKYKESITALFKHICKLKDQKKPYEIKCMHPHIIQPRRDTIYTTQKNPYPHIYTSSSSKSAQ